MPTMIVGQAVANRAARSAPEARADRAAGGTTEIVADHLSAGCPEAAADCRFRLLAVLRRHGPAGRAADTRTDCRASAAADGITDNASQCTAQPATDGGAGRFASHDALRRQDSERKRGE
ncbi:hypothetical protein J2T49_002637 [Pseudomonas nitroreducens]|nr:hypothetical protein [Pseudomonas nitroreducens]MCP1686689.1 hypothetical protein [Pseudomonas nitroreducens]